MRVPLTQIDARMTERWAVAERLDGTRAVRADDLVVAHVDDEQVGLKFGGLPGHLVDDVRVDRDDPQVVDLEPPPGVGVAQLRLEQRGEPEPGLGRPPRGRLPEDEDPEMPGFLVAG